MRNLVLLATTATLLSLGAASGTAWAADPLEPIVEAPAPAASGITGYVDLTIGGAWQTYIEGYPDYTYYEGEETEVDLSGSARVAIPVAPKLTVQLDAWANAWTGEGYCDAIECDDDGYDEYDFDGIRGGLAAHLAYLLDDGLVGGLVSVGIRNFNGDDENQWATVALEAVKDMENIRAYVQAGASFAIGGYDADNEEASLFAQGVLAYFIDPDLAVSVNAGIGRWAGQEYDESEIDLTWGARIEKHMEGMPFVLYVGYQGWAYTGGPGVEPDYEWSGVTHGVYAGIRFPFGEGAGTLRDLSGNVGLIDMNPGYGDLPH